MTDSGTITLNYATDFEKVVDNGHSIEAEVKGNAEINGRQYNLNSFTFMPLVNMKLMANIIR
jgi:carbonic anhydrase